MALEEAVLLEMLDEEAGVEEELEGATAELEEAEAELDGVEELAARELLVAARPQEPSVKSEAAAKMKKNLFLDIKRILPYDLSQIIRATSLRQKTIN